MFDLRTARNCIHGKQVLCMMLSTYRVDTDLLTGRLLVI
jgi:hypothetical protein